MKLPEANSTAQPENIQPEKSNAPCYRDILINALNKMAEVFTSQSEKSFDDVMSSGLKPFADAAGLNRIAVYRTIKPSGAMGQIYAWAQGKTTDLDETLLELPMSLTQWLEKLTNGEYINGNVADMEAEHAAFWSRYGAKSIFFVPIFTHGTFWGFVAQEDHSAYRYFEENDIDLLCSAARLCANAFMRNEIEREIADANEFNRATLDAAPIGLTVFDESLHITYCNDAILTLLGCSKEYYSNHFFDLMPDYQSDGTNSRIRADEILNRALAGERLTLEWMHLSVSGDLIPFEVTLTRAAYRGKYILMVYQYDLLNLKKVEKAAAEAEELTRAVTEASPIPYVLFDEDMQAIDCNDAALQIFFCTDKSYFLANYWKMFTPELQRSKIKSLEEAKAKAKELPINGQIRYEWVHRAFNGELIPMENTLTQVTHRGKKTYISFKYDMRNTIAMMESIRQQSELLKEALDKATIASRAKSDFLSNMSHEIRTPLNAIIGMTTIGKNAAVLERKDYALNRIEDASIHLLGIINDILDMSKIEANKFELSNMEFNFEKMLQQVVNVINFRVEEKQQQLRITIDKKIPAYLIGDNQRLAQVITNLAGNAVKFTPEEGTINIDASLVAEKYSLCTIQIIVSDTGIGISSEQQERLFQSFQQAENNISRKFGGTGLGLAISKNIIEMMGGEIWVESELGNGSTFAFTFKAKRGEKVVQWPSVSQAQMSSLRILVVDDDPDTVAFFKEIIQDLGASCDAAYSSEEALDLIEQNGTYDIYFLDWKLPGIDGVQLASILTHRENNIPTILFSAASWSSVEDAAKQAGIVKFLSKPLFPSTIREAIYSCMNDTDMQAVDALPQSETVFQGNRVLLVEDVEINREIVLALLEPTKLQIDCAENGAEAVQLFLDSPNAYNMILMDLQMPEMDGISATRIIRDSGIGRSETIPIIAMTANVFQEDIEKCFDAGMNDHLGKPLDFGKVIAMLHKYLGNTI